MADIFEITGRIHSTSQEHVTTVADEILDETKGKKQSQINAETDATLAEHTSTINGLNSQNYVTVTATDQTTAVTDVLPATGEVATVYRVGNWDGSQYDVTCYSEYSWNGTQYKHLSTKTQIGEVFDISAYHASGGTLATYADLAAALDSNNGGGVPQSLQKGGMSVKFVQSSDNKYVQARLMANSFTTDVNQWQTVDDEPTDGSDNLVKSGGVADCIYDRTMGEIMTPYSTGVGYVQISEHRINSNSNYTHAIYDISGKNNIVIKYESVNLEHMGIAFSNDATFTTISRWLYYTDLDANNMCSTEGYNYVAITKSYTDSQSVTTNRGDVYEVALIPKYQDKLISDNFYITADSEVAEINIKTDNDVINTTEIPMATSNNVGLMNGSDKTLLDALASQSETASYNNIAGSYNTHKGTGLTMTVNGDGSRTFSLQVGAGYSQGKWLYLLYELESGISWINNHEYLVVIDALVANDSHAIDGNTYMSILPKADASTTVGSETTVNGLVVGTRGYYRCACSVESSDGANILYIQLSDTSKYDNTDSITITIYGISVIDLTVNSLSQASAISIVNEYGILPVYNIINFNVNYADRSRVAETIENLEVGRDIDIWGDSIVVQDWGANLQTLTSRNVTSHGFGGMTSTFIRDRFIEGYDAQKTNIIFVGRNNYGRTDSVIKDIRAMTSLLGNNFIIMLPWNGCYTAEFKEGGSAYHIFVELAEKLYYEYQDNFLDTRKAVIDGWDCGDVKLLSSFVQPAIGGSVQINVSDANFLAYNSVLSGHTTDIDILGTETMNKIVIEFNGSKDVYSIVSKDDSTHLTVTLVSHELFDVGETVDNPLDSKASSTPAGYTPSIDYLSVKKYPDWLLINEYDTTPSSFRRDLVHMETSRDDKARTFLAKVVARKLNALKI